MIDVELGVIEAHADDGDLLISARNTSAVYRVDRTTGEVLPGPVGGLSSPFIAGT